MQLLASVQLIAVYWRDGNRGWAHAAMALLAVDYSVGVVVTAVCATPRIRTASCPATARQWL